MALPTKANITALVCKGLNLPKLNQEIPSVKFGNINIKANNKNTSKRIVEIIEKTKLFASSFDIFHLAFCEDNNCKLITFDKGFKKLQNISKIEIDIKQQT